MTMIFKPDCFAFLDNSIFINLLNASHKLCLNLPLSGSLSLTLQETQQKKTCKYNVSYYPFIAVAFAAGQNRKCTGVYVDTFYDNLTVLLSSNYVGQSLQMSDCLMVHVSLLTFRRPRH